MLEARLHVYQWYLYACPPLEQIAGCALHELDDMFVPVSISSISVHSILLLSSDTWV